MISGNMIIWLKENLKIKIKGKVQERDKELYLKFGPAYHEYVEVSLILDGKVISKDEINLSVSQLNWDGAKEMNAKLLKQRIEWLAKHNEATLV